VSQPETLLAEAVNAVQRGDFRTAADRFERAGAILGPIRPNDAVHAYESAARMRLAVDDLRHATADVAHAMKIAPDAPRVLKVNAEVVDKTGDLAARKMAWLAVADVGDTAMRREAHLQLATIARASNEHALAESYFVAALEELEPDSDPTLRPELWIEIAIARTALQDFSRAEQALAEAEPLVSAEDPDGMRARIAGQRGVIALGQGDHDTALRYAEAARSGAVDRNDVFTYISASTLVAAVYEQREQLVEAYDTYVRARESLADLLGPEAKGLVQPAVQLFEERLGPEKFKQVWDAWVAMRKAAKP